MEVWQALEFIWDSQIEPFIELNMGLDLIIGRFRADFVRGAGLYPTPEELVHGNFFADKNNTMLLPAWSAVVTTNLSCRFWRHFFHTFVVKNGLCLRETKPLGKLCRLAL